MQKLSTQKELLKKFLKNGVQIDDSESVYVEGDIKIGKGTQIHPNVYLINANIGKNCSIGPVASIRDSKIGNDVRIGFTAQVNRCKISDGTVMVHHSYLGDAIVGRNVNIGAGFITCNFDGADKHGTKIGNHAFLGSNSCLIAPVTIGEGCSVAAGSVIPANTKTGKRNLIIARSKEIFIKKLKIKK